MNLPPLIKRLLDATIVIVLTMALVLVMVVVSNLLVARTNSFVGFKLWYAFMTRPDILGTVILTAIVYMTYATWQQRGKAR